MVLDPVLGHEQCDGSSVSESEVGKHCRKDFVDRNKKRLNENKN